MKIKLENVFEYKCDSIIVDIGYNVGFNFHSTDSVCFVFDENVFINPLAIIVDDTINTNNLKAFCRNNHIPSKVFVQNNFGQITSLFPVKQNLETDCCVIMEITDNFGFDDYISELCFLNYSEWKEYYIRFHQFNVAVNSNKIRFIYYNNISTDSYKEFMLISNWVDIPSVECRK
ncbi:MAG: hypothetical protein JEZ03_14700 [Bacteroidales bacterium]|nr:hypothetical protein [Bacteroidales bacterium]